MNHAVYASDLESKQFLDTEVKMPAQKTQTKKTTKYIKLVMSGLLWTSCYV